MLHYERLAAQSMLALGTRTVPDRYFMKYETAAQEHNINSLSQRRARASRLEPGGASRAVGGKAFTRRALIYTGTGTYVADDLVSGNENPKPES